MEITVRMFEFGLQHWPFFAFALVAMMFNQVIKTSLFTKTRAHTKSKLQWFWWWAWKTLPLHPVILGLITGLIWQNPENADPGWRWQASMFYFAVAGTCSVWLYQFIKGVAKRKGFVLENLPGEKK
jgi:hypothetical protein